MDSDRLRIEEDLRGELDGDVHCDELFVQLYASDASIYEIRPLGVVRPRHAADAAAVVRYAAENDLALHPRGSGSGVAGESLGPGLVVDFARYMSRIIDDHGDCVRVQAGVVLDQLNRHLAKQGRLFGPDPNNSAVTTIGGMLAIDAAGSRQAAYGRARDRVVEIDAVLADGRLVTLNNQSIPDVLPQRDDAPEATLAHEVAQLTQQFGSEIAAEASKAFPFHSGYRLDDVCVGGAVDLARLMVGSEGTLALFTAAKVATAAQPRSVGAALLLFDSLDKAAQAAAVISQDASLAACDLMDRRHLSLAREQDPRYELLIPQSIEAVLLLEQHGDGPDDVQESLAGIVDRLTGRRGLAAGSHVAVDDLDSRLLQDLAQRFVPTLYSLQGMTRPIPLVEAVSVPPELLPDFLRRAQQAFNDHQVTASVFAHAALGHLHMRPFLDLANPGDVEKMQSLAERLYEHVWELGGSIGGRHGDGLSRTPFVARQAGPLAEAFRDLKQLFDPEMILNPGKKVFSASTDVAANLRRFTYPLLQQIARAENPSIDAPQLIELQLDWHAGEMAHAARICNGCAVCRTRADDVRMCPIFHLAPREEASPRAKANLARGILTGSLPAGTVLEDACKEISDLCVHCHMCRVECPAHVDIPKLMVEAKASYVATNGLKMHDWALTRIDRLCAIAARTPRVANWALGNRVARWTIEKLIGVAQGRKLPAISHGHFLQRPTAKRLRRPQRSSGEKALLFVDTYANYCDPQLAEALVAVLEHNGIDVYVPDKQREAGMPMISQGALDPARRVAEINVPIFAEAVRQGYAIVSTEPSAVLALRKEYPQLLADDSDAATVADASFEACHYLWRHHQRGRLELDFRALSLDVGYHAPCHLKALEVGTPTINLLRLIPGVRVRPIEKGCSGMAGLYGLKRKNYRNSLRAGLPLFDAMRTGPFQAGVTECSTCRLQMSQGSAKPTLHPIKILALAYGLLPEIREQLNRPADDLVVK